MELRQLQYFVAVAETGGFGRAAEHLGIVQSAVSQQIRRLERALGVTLFDRSARRVRLTGAGERLLPEARTALAAADRVRRVAADIASGTGGLLRLGVIRGPGDRVYRLLDELAAQAPGLRVRTSRMPVTERLAAVRAGELDAALVRAMPAAPGLELLPLWTEPLYVALPAAHPLADCPEPRPEQLAGLPLRLAPRARNPPFHDLVTDLVRATGAEPVPGPPFTDLQDTLGAIAADPPSWTVFYDVTGTLPTLTGVAVRPLAAPGAPTSLAVPPGVPGPALRPLIRALSRRPGPDGAPPGPARELR